MSNGPQVLLFVKILASMNREHEKDIMDAKA